MDFDRMNSTGYLANHMARLFAEGLRQRIEPLGIVPGQFPTLLELWQNDGQTQMELVGKLDVEQATLANTLGRMERDGLITRKEHPTDGRARVVRLTKKSKAIREGAYRAAHATNQMAMANLSPAEQDQFIAMMNKIIQGMRNSN